MTVKTKGIVFYTVLIGVAALLWAVVRNGPIQIKATYSQFLQQVQSGQVARAIIVAAQTGANQIDYSLKDGNRVQTMVPSDYRDVLEALQQNRVNVEIRDASAQWLRIVQNSAPFLLLLGFWVFMMGRLRNRGAK
jgi:cell division protease FtsH